MRVLFSIQLCTLTTARVKLKNTRNHHLTPTVNNKFSDRPDCSVNIATHGYIFLPLVGLLLCWRIPKFYFNINVRVSNYHRVSRSYTLFINSVHAPQVRKNNNADGEFSVINRFGDTRDSARHPGFSNGIYPLSPPPDKNPFHG